MRTSPEVVKLVSNSTFLIITALMSSLSLSPVSPGGVSIQCHCHPSVLVVCQDSVVGVTVTCQSWWCVNTVSSVSLSPVSLSGVSIQCHWCHCLPGGVSSVSLSPISPGGVSIQRHRCHCHPSVLVVCQYNVIGVTVSHQSWWCVIGVTVTCQFCLSPGQKGQLGDMHCDVSNKQKDS